MAREDYFAKKNMGMGSAGPHDPNWFGNRFYGPLFDAVDQHREAQQPGGPGFNLKGETPPTSDQNEFVPDSRGLSPTGWNRVAQLETGVLSDAGGQQTVSRRSTSLLDAYPRQDPRTVTFAEPDETLSFSERLKKLTDGADFTSIGQKAVDLHVAAGKTVAAIGRAIHPFTPVGIGQAIGTDIAERPGEFPTLFRAAERQTRLVDTMFSEGWSREEAYDRRIKAVKAATGIDLPNPERGGYSLNERELRELSADGPIDPAVYRRQRFERDLSATIADNPGKAADLQFGDINAEAKAIAQGAEHDYEAARKDTKLSTASSLATQLGGGMWGQRRDPLAVGSLFAGPTSAIGRTVAARIASSGLFQGLYNAGVSALEQPAVQAWRSELGLKSGAVPAAENVGLAFLFGLIPGAVFRGVHEIPAMLRPSVKRVLDGVPEAGDVEKAMAAARSALGEIDAGMQPAARAKIATSLEHSEEGVRFLADGGGELATKQVGNRLVVQGAAVPEELRGQGRGLALYERAIAYADERGLIFTSDTGVKQDAIRVYDALKRRGYEVAENPNFNPNATIAEIKENPQWRFEVRPSKSGKNLPSIQDRAIKLGTDIDEAARATAPARAKDVSPELHDDLTAAAERHGEDPAGQPSPAAVAYVNSRGEAAPLPAGTEVLHEPIGEGQFRSGVYRTPITDTAGNRIGHFEFQVTDTSVEVRHSFIEPDQQGKGHGIDAYQQAVDWALAQGKTFSSGDDVSAQAARMYEALRRRGYTVEGTEAPFRVTAGPAKPAAAAEIEARVAEAAPRTEREAQMAASEAIEDIGNRATVARTAEELERDRLPPPTPPPEGVKMPPASSKDPLDKIPLARDDGTATMVSARQLARAGERETELGELVRACR